MFKENTSFLENISKKSTSTNNTIASNWVQNYIEKKASLLTSAFISAHNKKKKTWGIFQNASKIRKVLDKIMTTNSQLRHFRITSKKILVVKLGKYHYESKPKIHLVL